MAGVTGLEPAASGVTGRRSNQLSYAPTFSPRCVRSADGHCQGCDSTIDTQFLQRQLAAHALAAYQADCPLPSTGKSTGGRMVGGDGIEPPTLSV